MPVFTDRQGMSWTRAAGTAVMSSQLTENSCSPRLHPGELSMRRQPPLLQADGRPAQAAGPCSPVLASITLGQSLGPALWSRCRSRHWPNQEPPSCSQNAVNPEVGKEAGRWLLNTPQNIPGLTQRNPSLATGLLSPQGNGGGWCLPRRWLRPSFCPVARAGMGEVCFLQAHLPPRPHLPRVGATCTGSGPGPHGPQMGPTTVPHTDHQKSMCPCPFEAQPPSPHPHTHLTLLRIRPREQADRLGPRMLGEQLISTLPVTPGCICKWPPLADFCFCLLFIFF